MRPTFRAAVATCSSPRSDVTNEARIAGCAVNPGDRGLRIREVESRCSRPTYIYTTFVPLAPGKVPEDLVLEASQPTRQARVEGFLAYGPFAGAFRCATLDTRRRGALEDYFLVVAQPARDARHQPIQVIGGLLRQRGLP
jgi:hypothetical protein